ncbi:hypothetical protein SE17_00005 [Kouleothrix aurantiaca]|uniref:Uncharacterized protein n=1 Tax=Kouleothrix aurantiaca TaxID=186479 RepID=A0A0P9DHN0_9CHLR|nr:hypothetical protein SE17_00005 [Kouleothrix aurantiaca]
MVVSINLAVVEHAIRRERQYQDQKWGTLQEHPHALGAWLTLIRHRLRKAEDAWCGAQGNDEALRRILQVASLITACLEQHLPAVKSFSSWMAESDVGSWLTILTHKLRVAERTWMNGDAKATLSQLSVLRAACCACLMQNGVPERPAVRTT